MTIENQKYRLQAEDFVTRVAEANKGPHGMAVAFSRALIAYGREHIIEALKQKDPSITILITPEDLDRIFEQTPNELGLMIVGAANLVIHHALADGQYQTTDFAEEMNRGLVGTPIRWDAARKPGLENIPQSDLVDMYPFASKEPIFTAFYGEEGMRHIPPALREELIPYVSLIRPVLPTIAEAWNLIQ